MRSGNTAITIIRGNKKNSKIIPKVNRIVVEAFNKERRVMNYWFWFRQIYKLLINDN
jgi:hypothetical protein